MVLIQFSKSFLNFSAVGVISLLVVTAPLLLMSMSTNSAYLGATNNAYAQQSQTEQPSYFITIIPGPEHLKWQQGFSVYGIILCRLRKRTAFNSVFAKVHTKIMDEI